MEALRERWPGRRAEIEQLEALLCTLRPPAIYLHGHTGTGKTSILRDTLQSLGLTHLFVSVAESYSSRTLLQTLYDRLVALLPEQEEDGGSRALARAAPYKKAEKKCERMSKLVMRLKQRLPPGRRLYLALDRAERLRDMEAHILPAFMRLGELAERDVTVVLVSELAWDRFHSVTGLPLPYELHFPPYSRDALVEILGRERPRGEDDPRFFSNYVKLVVDVFGGACREVTELRHLVHLVWPSYSLPVAQGIAKKADSGALLMRIKPVLKQVFDRLYRRDAELPAAGGGGGGAGPSAAADAPKTTKLLALAGYLASYNPPRTDQHYFSTSRNNKPGRKRRAPAGRPAGKDLFMLGPQAFPLERMLAVFRSIAEEDGTALTTDLLGEVATLARVGVLLSTGEGVPIDKAKFKCTVGHEDAKRLARDTGIALHHYLCP